MIKLLRIKANVGNIQTGRKGNVRATETMMQMIFVYQFIYGSFYYGKPKADNCLELEFL